MNHDGVLVVTGLAGLELKLYFQDLLGCALTDVEHNTCMYSVRLLEN